MKADQFIQWLKGFVDVSGGTPTGAEWGRITERLNSVQEPVVPSALHFPPNVRGFPMFSLKDNTEKPLVDTCETTSETGENNGTS